MKREIVKKILEMSGAEPEMKPVGFFMAGLPGPGKTEILKNIDADNMVEKWLRDVFAKEIDGIIKMEYYKDKLIKYIKGA